MLSMHSDEFKQYKKVIIESESSTPDLQSLSSEEASVKYILLEKSHACVCVLMSMHVCI